MTGIVEEADRIRSCRLHAPRVGIDGAVQRTKASIVYGDDFEPQALQGLLKQRDIIVWICEPADLAGIAFIANQQRNALLSLRARRRCSEAGKHQKKHKPDTAPHSLTPPRQWDSLPHLPCPLNHAPTHPRGLARQDGPSSSPRRSSRQSGDRPE